MHAGRQAECEGTLRKGAQHDQQQQQQQRQRTICADLGSSRLMRPLPVPAATMPRSSGDASTTTLSPLPSIYSSGEEAGGGRGGVDSSEGGITEFDRQRSGGGWFAGRGIETLAWQGCSERSKLATSIPFGGEGSRWRGSVPSSR